jgi:hypothetical protein
MQKFRVAVIGFAFPIIFLYGCAISDTQVKHTPNPETADLSVKDDFQDTSRAFGPFFLPESPSLASVSLNYVTDKPEMTKVYFSMMGRTDWARFNFDKNIYHKMLFSNLEEEAFYTFEIESESSNVSRMSGVVSPPYSPSYEFTFAVADFNMSLPELGKAPNFLVVISKNGNVNEEEFREFNLSNRMLLASTIIIPAFEFEMDNKQVSVMQNGVFFARYRNLSLVVINDELDDIDKIARYLSTKPNDFNYIVISSGDTDFIENIYRACAVLADKIITLADLPSSKLALFNIEYQAKKGVAFRKNPNTSFAGDDW